MAEAVRRPSLPPEVVVCVCATFIRLSIWSTMVSPPSVQSLADRRTKTTWRLSGHHSTIPLRSAQGVTLPVMLLVTEEPSGKVLAFCCLQSSPTSGELGLTLYDALVYPQLGQRSLRPQLHAPA